MKFYKHPLFLFIAITVLIFSLIYSYLIPKDSFVLLAGGSVLVLSVMTYLFIRFLHWGDEYLFIIISMLVVIGVAMLYRLDSEYGFKQIMRYGMGIIMFSVSYLLYRYINIWNKLKWFYAGASIFLFLITLLFGSNVGGAKNWIIIGGMALQPSEFIKLLTVFYLACYFTGQPKAELQIGRLKEKYITLFVIYTFLGFLILQREWGSLVLFFVTYLVLLYIYKSDYHIIILNLALMCVVGYFGYHFLNHIQVRVANWIDPWSDVSGRGYQITQSLFAIASGGFFGTGIGLGKPLFIPEVHSDFIFSAICEEMGIFGGTAVILMYFILVYRGVKISLRQTGFDKCVALGITVFFAMQTFIIIGGVIKMIPLTGITLPFVSYGGSSLLASFISMGILQAVSAKGGDEFEN